MGIGERRRGSRPVVFMQPSDLAANFNATVVFAEAMRGLWQGAIVPFRTRQATALLVAPPIAADLAPADFTCWSQRLEAQRSMMKRLGGTTGCSISRPPAAASFPGWIGEATG